MDYEYLLALRKTMIKEIFGENDNIVTKYINIYLIYTITTILNSFELNNEELQKMDQYLHNKDINKDDIGFLKQKITRVQDKNCIEVRYVYSIEGFSNDNTKKITIVIYPSGAVDHHITITKTTVNSIE